MDEETVELSVGTCKVVGYTNKEVTKSKIRGQMIAQEYSRKREKIQAELDKGLCKAPKSQQDAIRMHYTDVLDDLDDSKAEDVARLMAKTQASKIIEHDFDLSNQQLYQFIGGLKIEDREKLEEAIDRLSHVQVRKKSKKRSKTPSKSKD